MSSNINAYEQYVRYYGGGKIHLSHTRSLTAQYNADAAFWWGTTKHPGTKVADIVLQRIWSIIWWGGLYMKNRGGHWIQWSSTDMPVASCLSHGGRVLIQLPRDDTKSKEIWKWIWGPHSPQERFSATHGVTRITVPEMIPNGRSKNVNETDKASGGKHFGVNIAGGGFNNKNPISNKTIINDGRHGHMYIHYLPSKKDGNGAILVGVEDTAPIDRAKTSLSQSIGWLTCLTLFPVVLIELPIELGLTKATGHGMLLDRLLLPKGQVGSYHGIGGSGEYSVTGGDKFKEVDKAQKKHGQHGPWQGNYKAWNAAVVPSEKNSMFVNPKNETWTALLLESKAFDTNDFGFSPPAESFQ